MSLSDYASALVTGASSGIGAAVVRELRARDITVHALARREDRLAALAAETGCIPHVVDVCDTQALRGAARDIEADILVNNAGLGRGFGDVFAADHADIDVTIDTNVKALLHLLRAALPHMVERRRGHVVNIGSVAGLYPINSTLYGASKGAVHLMGMNLRIELAGSGVRVTEICPGRVETEFFDAAIDDPQVRERVTDTGVTVLQATDIAAAVLYALDAPWHVNVSMIELQPTEQHFGGGRFKPVKG